MCTACIEPVLTLLYICTQIVDHVNGAHLKEYHCPPSHNQTEPPSHNQTEPPSHDQTEPPSHDQMEPPSHDQTEPPSHDQTKPPPHKRGRQTEPLSLKRSQPTAQRKKRNSAAKNRLFQCRQARVKDTVNSEVVDVETYVPKKNHRVKMWLPDFGLTDDDRQILLNPVGWLTDSIVNAAQNLLKQAAPQVSSLQDVTHGMAHSFNVETGEFVQVLNNQRGHWLLVSTIGCPHPTVHVYDSMLRSAGTHVKSQVASLLNTQQPTIELQFMDCQVQSGGSDCGLFSIANATALIFGEDPGRLFYDQASMRQHLFKCLENKCMLPFPTKRVRRALKRVVTVDPFEVHCICRMPEMFVGEKWAECTKCNKWYHTDSCLNMTEEMLEGDWNCPDCS